ncbi:hypothetical protein PVAP13_1NG107300 [Panicum virgatum]|uniref:Uncharacterized protein n=1 Tax=Panicum virgatum TaxID=38727 RepID=A0A8T0WHC1_PANVG|nr:hypothetical protein PVAP13_1NG107300 [Panicum virgatum]
MWKHSLKRRRETTQNEPKLQPALHAPDGPVQTHRTVRYTHRMFWAEATLTHQNPPDGPVAHRRTVQCTHRMFWAKATLAHQNPPDGPVAHRRTVQCTHRTIWTEGSCALTAPTGRSGAPPPDGPVLANVPGEARPRELRLGKSHAPDGLVQRHRTVRWYETGWPRV